ncbi:cryptochrome/photolyase family protein [Fulvivirga lutimaris]|uniref:cryptochrome/photolyase family protein n=1 Tax=Fulvivirga lutimaris TaxID=1819566 RepID=UPI00162953E5|nr:cryptochrome/photolyase family protein [Fulvivirga lutimaris]
MIIALVYPHQLFKKSPLLDKADAFILVEDELYFNQYNFHKNKLILHRASMKYYASILVDLGKSVSYIDRKTSNTTYTALEKAKSIGATEVIVISPDDYLLTRRVDRYARQLSLTINCIENPGFLTSSNELNTRLTKNKTGYFMASFYKNQRVALDLLIDNGEPTGGKWSFDEDNRKKLPKNIKLLDIEQLNENAFVKEAKEYVEANFKTNLGSPDAFNYPITHKEAKQWLDKFLIERMEKFGDYEDAIAKDQSILFHSLLTPALNIGLLTPQQVIDRTMELHKKHDFPINSLEGFIRQIIGWREFVRGIYLKEGVFERTNNYFNYSRKIPASFYNGTTGIEPVDQTIKKVLSTGYCHHIERLMILGNFMLLCEFDPDEVYRWFMELFIDAYDWVMVPNIYGMTQYADGGLITTKPYISGSNYILKMSDYQKGKWCEIWDGLYWNFIYQHQQKFSSNQRMKFNINMLNKMNTEKLTSHVNNAQSFLETLDNSIVKEG